jgi:hypothetical protein
MRVAQISNEAHIECSKLGEKYTLQQYTSAAQAIQEAFNTPIELLYLSKITYDTKAAHYTATFTGSLKTATLKVSIEVGEFLTAHLRAPGIWYGRMYQGVLVDVNLRQA